MPHTSPITYSIQNDTANGIVNPTSLSVEIKDDTRITVSLNNISTIGDDLLIYFNADLPDADKPYLDTIVAAHTGASNETDAISVNISPMVDETNRPMVRIDSRDAEDTTCFTTRGDLWVTVVDQPLRKLDGTENGNGAATVFYLPEGQCEARGLSVKVGGSTVDPSNYTYDATEHDSDYNQTIHFSEGVITFNTPPGNGVAVTASYQYAVIGGGPKAAFDFEGSGLTEKIIDIEFCDPMHIKDGMLYWINGAPMHTFDVYVVVPPWYPWRNNNGTLLINDTGADLVCQHYVVNTCMIGDCPMGTDMTVEARSMALFPGYKIRFVFRVPDTNSTLKCSARIEINRQRLFIKRGYNAWTP
jgi:hypothetical protein